MAMICSSIQSGSSSSQIIRKLYDVFVSFRGKDTRNNFTDHLFGALQRKGILTFRDDKKLKKGQSIAPELSQAIEGSQVLVVVFSKNYASSTWCLRELVKILDCVQVSRKHVLPIFYDVDPSEVRKQSGDYEKAFADHEERFKDDLEKMVEVKGWREALTQVANLSGWDVRDRPQYTEIEKIVEEIISILAHKLSSLPNDIIGMQTPLEELEKVLLLSSVDDVRVVGISGMGGIGKTTLATILYDRISHQYDACCFIDDVSKTYKDQGPIGAQRQILHQALNGEYLQTWNHYNTSNLIRSRLKHVRALIVLDNVDHIEQLEKLAVKREWLGAGSRIIIISRDEHILNVYRADEIYKVPFLNRDNSIQLFCRKAFNCDDIVRDYKVLTNAILEYAKGLPLAIKVIGSFLFDRDVSEWRSALVRLRENPSKDIMDVLRLSFDGLEKSEKEIFLDIACFFCRYPEAYVKNVLNCCGFHADLGIGVLIHKSLISIYVDPDFLVRLIEMHGLLQKVGMKIVEEESRKWSRLWTQNSFYNVMSENMEKNVEAIVFTWKNIDQTKMLMAETLSKMCHLRLLILSGNTKFSGSLNCLSNELRYVNWYNYPFMYLPSTFHPNKLVELILKHSNIKQAWKGDKYLPNLKILDLSHSKNLTKMPDFGEVPNLERLNLEGCVKLVQVDPSIGCLRKLIYLNLKDCKSLVSIPNNILGLISLEYLNFSGCSKVFNNLMHVELLKKLDTDETTSHSQSLSTIFKWITLPFHFLYPRAHKDSCSTSCLLPSLPNFSCLHELDLSFCGLSQVPDAIGSLYCLEKLNLGGNNFVTLPSLKELSKLVHLNLPHCKQLKSLPELPSPVKFSPRRQLVKDVIFSHLVALLPKARLFIFNCPKLGDKERCNIMIFSWMIQVIQVNQKSFDPLAWIEIVTPGSEIPRWFHNQNVGSSISIDSSTMMLDNNCIGVAFCAVLATHSDPTIITSKRNSGIQIHFVYECHGRLAVICAPLDGELVTVKSDHMWLFYFTRKYFLDRIGSIIHKKLDLDKIKLFIWARHVNGLHLEVKNCGYRWVFKQDLNLSRKRKFLEIEDESTP